jgi:DNA-binding LytR/AlgR family response regulator
MGLEQRISRETNQPPVLDCGNARLQESTDRLPDQERQPALPVIPGGAHRLTPVPAQTESTTRLRLPRWNPQRIAVKARGKIHLIDPLKILAAEAHNNYVLLQQIKDSHLLREQISILAEKLEPFGFIRIHRSVLVNIAHVEELEPQFTGAYLLRMRGGKEYSVTRTYKKNLQLLARSWIGMDGLFAD